MKNKKINKDIIVIFGSEGLALDTQETSGKAYFNDALLADFRSEPYKAMLYFGFEDKHPDMSESLSFLHGICRDFIDSLSRDPDIEITRSAKTPETAVFLDMLHRIPYVVGVEYVSVDWFADLWAKLAAVFEQEIAG